MTSKTSCFDSAIFKRSLRKTLPLWACYFLFWLFILPGDLISFNYQPEYYDSLTGRLCRANFDVLHGWHASFGADRSSCGLAAVFVALPREYLLFLRRSARAARGAFPEQFLCRLAYGHAGKPPDRSHCILRYAPARLPPALCLRLLLRHEHTFVCRLLRLCGASGDDHRSGSRHARGICDFKLYQLCPLLLCAVPAVGVCLRHEQYLS